MQDLLHPFHQEVLPEQQLGQFQTVTTSTTALDSCSCPHPFFNLPGRPKFARGTLLVPTSAQGDWKQCISFSWTVQNRILFYWGWKVSPLCKQPAVWPEQLKCLCHLVLFLISALPHQRCFDSKFLSAAWLEVPLICLTFSALSPSRINLYQER